MNITPTRREVAQTIEMLESATSRLRETFEQIADTSNSERHDLIAEAREAIQKARQNGNAWKIWERITDEYEHGGPDARGTDYDPLRALATTLDATQGATIKPQLYVSISFHPQTAEEAIAVIDALPDAGWRLRDGNIVGGRDLGLDSFFEPITVFVKGRVWVGDMLDHLRGLTVQDEDVEAVTEELVDA